jgi:hypothetical protein
MFDKSLINDLIATAIVSAIIFGIFSFFASIEFPSFHILSNDQINYAKQLKIDDANKFYSLLCEEKQMCRDYSEYKYECATAGQIKQCIQIKMNKGKDYQLKEFASDYCKDDGSLYDAPNNLVPSVLQCLVL